MFVEKNHKERKANQSYVISMTQILLNKILYNFTILNSIFKTISGGQIINPEAAYLNDICNIVNTHLIRTLEIIEKIIAIRVRYISYRNILEEEIIGVGLFIFFIGANYWQA
ncbi:hypothetical protein ACJX0J_016288, partial [Zea mays]